MSSRHPSEQKPIHVHVPNPFSPDERFPGQGQPDNLEKKEPERVIIINPYESDEENDNKDGKSIHN
ncbi:MAG: hypothetical protein WC025_02295 [Candidatus Magasanikbacteria bacterium]